MRARMMLTLVVAVAVVAAACGDSRSSFLPTGPSALPAGITTVDASTTAIGSGTMGNGPKPGNGNGQGNSPTPVTIEAVKVEFEGTIDGFGEGSIIVDNQTVYVVTGQTVIRKGDRNVLFSELKKGDRVHVSANRVGTTITATEIKLQNPCNTCPVEPPTPDPDQVVSVMAVDTEAVEGGTDNATFRLSRIATDRQREAALSVSFTLGGTATADDYAPITSITFPGGQLTVDVVVSALNDSATERETVQLTVTPAAGYVVGSPASATVTIVDPLPQVSVTAPDPDANEFENGGRFEVTRDGDLSLPLTVTLEFSGTALLDVPEPDYTVTSPAASGTTLTFTFLSGQASQLVFVMPLFDRLGEPEETIILTVVDGADYDRGAQFSATVFIAASDPR